MPLIPANQMPDSTNEESQAHEKPPATPSLDEDRVRTPWSQAGPAPQSDPDEFDPAKVKVGHIKDPDKVAAKIEAARLKHMEIRKAVKVCIEAGAEFKPIEPEPPAPPVQVIERRIETVTVKIPLGEPPHRFQSIHIGEALVYGEHAQTWARLRQGLRDKGAKTADGRVVRSGPDMLRWLLEQFASAGGGAPESQYPAKA